MRQASSLTKRPPSELTQRVITGLVGITILLLIVTKGGWFGVFLVATTLSLAMIDEYSRIAYSLPDRIEKRYFLLCISWFSALANLFSPGHELEILLSAFFALFVYFLAVAKRFGGAAPSGSSGEDFHTHFKELTYSLFGMVWLVLLPFYLSKICDLPVNGSKWVWLFLAVIWGGDTGAYFAGRRFGRHKLYVKISPKKTWEGALGGLLLGFLASLLFKLTWFKEMHWASALIIPWVVGISGMIGDLSESFFKRAFEVKDSGSILPGHGGFLDRFDSVVFAMPIMYACIHILN